jgi:hypothetical protein
MNNLMGKATHRKASPGETLFGGGKGILIQFRPFEASTQVAIGPAKEEPVGASPTGYVDRGYYTDIGETESTIQDFVESEEKELGRPLTKEEFQKIVEFVTPELQHDYSEK